MTTTWVIGGIVAACLVVLGIWRLRKASGTIQRILDEERARTEEGEPEPAEPDTPVRRSREIDR